MGTNRTARRYVLKVGLPLLLLFGCYAISLLLFHWAPKDRNGHRPRDVAKAFIEAVQSNDFQRAASFWGPRAVQNVEANFQLHFRDFCIQTFRCESFDLGVTTRQQGGFHKVPFMGHLSGAKKSFGLYLKRIDNEWRIIEELWILSPTSPGDMEPLMPTNETTNSSA